MADENEEEKTEEPSEYRIQKARKEGNVAKTSELSGALVLLSAVLIMLVLGKYIFSQIIEFIHFYFSKCSNPNITDSSLYIAFLNYFLKCILPICAVGILSAIIGNIIQTKGFVISTEPIKPKINKILPNFKEYFKRTLFSLQGLFSIAKSIGKVAIICIVAYLYIKKDIFVLIEIIANGDIPLALKRIANMSVQILIVVSVIFLAISIPDYFVQRFEFKKKLKMTKQEQKEEYKELEGDPEVKNKLKQMQQELLKQNIPKAVSEADVVITNPTHYAVALKYDVKVADSPMVTAKGEDQVAQTIKRLAREDGIPIVENRPVARELYTNVEIGDIIPQVYYQTIAVIYSHLEKFKQN